MCDRTKPLHTNVGKTTGRIHKPTADFFLARAIELDRELKKSLCGCRYTTISTKRLNEEIYLRLKGYKPDQFEAGRDSLRIRFY